MGLMRFMGLFVDEFIVDEVYKVDEVDEVDEFFVDEVDEFFVDEG